MLENPTDAFSKMEVRKWVGSMEVYAVYNDNHPHLILNRYVGGTDILDNGNALFFVLSEADKFFPAPNNAAIYNIDGTLRHQLINPRQEKGWYIHSGRYNDSLKAWCVIVTNDHEWPELCFCLYDGSPNLIWTGYQLDRR
jgi:hypothetical protein